MEGRLYNQQGTNVKRYVLEQCTWEESDGVKSRSKTFLFIIWIFLVYYSIFRQLLVERRPVKVRDSPINVLAGMRTSIILARKSVLTVPTSSSHVSSMNNYILGGLWMNVKEMQISIQIPFLPHMITNDHSDMQ